MDRRRPQKQLWIVHVTMNSSTISHMKPAPAENDGFLQRHHTQNAPSLPAPDFPRTMAFLPFSYIINHVRGYREGAVADDAPAGGDERRGEEFMIHRISNKVHITEEAKRQGERMKQD